MKFAILGLGKTGHNIAATLVDKGFEVIGFTRDGEKAKDVNEHGITVTGALNGNFKAKATTNLDEAVNGAQYLIVTTTSKGHKPMAEMLKGKLQENQRIMIIVGNWGAYEFYSVLKNEAKDKNVIIGETAGILFGSPSLTQPATTFMKPRKKTMNIATIPSSAAQTVVDELKIAFPQFYAVANVIETSMNSTNPMVHVPLSIFNCTRVESGEDYNLYGSASPKKLMDFLMKADLERCAVTKAMGGNPQTILQLMNKAYLVNFDSVVELALNNPSLKTVKGPKSLGHRFLSEDVPFGILPVVRLGKKYGVPTPRLDLLVDCYRYLLDDEAELEGPEFDVEMSEVL